MYHEIKDEDKELWQGLLDNCKKYGVMTEFSDGQFTGNFHHETYVMFGSVITFYFEGNELVGID